MTSAISSVHLSKEYRLGVINHGMLYKDMQSWLARKLGRPDPHAKIGEDRFADQIDRFWALKDISFDIAQGDRIGIIGKNGAGKSTLLKILSRITAPTEGSVKIKGRIASLLEVGTGFHGELTGRENVYLNGTILGMKKKEIDKKFDEIVDFAEIEKFIDTPVKRYSSGMYVRLAFAVAAHLDSEILLADEVLAVGDAAFQKKAIGKMGDLSSSQGRTVLFVSHNMSTVKALCNKGILMDQGRVLAVDSMGAIAERYIGNTASGTSGVLDMSQFDGTLLKKIEFSTVEVVQDEEILSVIDGGRPFKIRVCFKVKGFLPGYRQTVNILSKELTLLCSLHDSEYISEIEPGSYCSEYSLPGKLLRKGEYTLGIGALSGSGSTPEGYVYCDHAYKLIVTDEYSDPVEPQYGGALFVNYFAERRDSVDK